MTSIPVQANKDGLKFLYSLTCEYFWLLYIHSLSSSEKELNGIAGFEIFFLFFFVVLFLFFGIEIFQFDLFSRKRLQKIERAQITHLPYK